MRRACTSALRACSQGRSGQALLLGPFDASQASYSPLLLSPETLSKVRWDVVIDQGPRGATVFGLSTLGLLLITSAVEISTGAEGDANEELKAVGISNVIGGLGGGLVVYHSLSSTQIAHSMAGRALRTSTPPTLNLLLLFRASV